MRVLLFVATMLLINTSASAIGLKLYVGSAEKQENQSTRFYLQLIVCNNMADTVYIKRTDLDNLYPIITNDVSIIGDGGTFLLLNYVKNLVTDKNELVELSKKMPEQVFDRKLTVENRQYKENGQLPHRMIDGIDYYVFAPEKCLTIGSTIQANTFEVVKLHNVTPKETKEAEVYLTTPVWYHTFHDKTDRHDVLISRASDDLKKVLFPPQK